MSYIPNCRPKYYKDATPVPYVKTNDIPEKEINPYYYGLLEGNDKEFLRGYDYNTAAVVNNLFDNLDMYVNEFESIGLDVENIDSNIVDGSIEEVNKYLNTANNRKEAKWLPDYTSDEIEKFNIETKIALLFKYMLNDYIESNRDMLVTSMIESMDEETHAKMVQTLSDDDS